MRLSYGWSSIELRQWATRAEMVDYLSGFEWNVVIGQSTEQEREFFSATIEPEFNSAESHRLALGACSEGHGILPQLLLLPSHGLVIVGVNSEVVAVRTDCGEIAFRVPLGFLFRSIVPLFDMGLLLVFHEIGVTALRDTGAIAWTTVRDVLEDVRVEEGILHMTFMDSAPTAVELTSGTEVR
jgi:hypothetical protein